MISFQEALAKLLATAVPLGAERVDLDGAVGRVLAEDLVAEAPMPAYDYSAMDGYAVATRDLDDEAPFLLPVVGESAAGGVAPELAQGTACRIFTGAELPRGADAVLMQEDTERHGQSLAFTLRPKPGAHVRHRGEDLAEGAVAVARGTRITPGIVALSAALDRPELEVNRTPIVTVLASGDELRAPGAPKRAGSIPESNGFFLRAAARSAGALVRLVPFVRDDAEATMSAVSAALRGTDLLVTIGGVSVGDRDYVRPALEAAGVTLDFYKVAIKPGKPIVVGRHGGTHVLGLPGNPASASLTFLLFGMPLLRALQGDAAPVPRRGRARIIGSLRRRAGREEFLRVKLEPAMNTARILPNQASGAVTSFAEADALAVVPAERERVEEGDELEILRIADV